MSNILDRLKEHEGHIKHVELLKKRHKKMSEDSFAFFRGTCRIFYEDLRLNIWDKLPGSPLVWNTGDLHLENFGVYRGSTNQLYLDINDFDEAALAPALWDVSRLAASMVVSCLCRDDEAVKGAARRIVDYGLETYGATLEAGRLLFMDEQTAKGEGAKKAFRKAKKVQDNLQEELDERTEPADGGKLLFDRTHHEHVAVEACGHDATLLMQHLKVWISAQKMQYLSNPTVEDVIFRVAGTGSIGRDRLLFLLRRPPGSESAYLFLELKEPGPLSMETWLPEIAPQPARHTEAHRIVVAQQRMQATPPPVLDITRYGLKDYLIQERQPEKKKIDFTKLNLIDTLDAIGTVAQLTAYAQLRSAGREGSASVDDLIAFGKDRGDWQKPVADYAEQVASATASYYDECKQAWKPGGTP